MIDDGTDYQRWADVLNAITHERREAEALAGVIEDVAYWESAACKGFAGSSDDTAEPIDCTMTSPLETITVTVPEAPVRMPRESMRRGESLAGLVTALLINEVRHRHTGLHWPIFSADSPLITDGAAILTFMIRNPCTTATTTTGGHIMYEITVAVRSDVLDAFDATLEGWEDRSEELAALVHLEDEVRDEGGALASADAVATDISTTSIDVRLDGHDLAALERILGAGGDDDALFTALMLGALNGHGDGDAVVSADDPLPISA